MSLDISIARSLDSATGVAAQFLDEVQNGSADDGDYPYAHVVTINGDSYIAFDTGLPSSREPWAAGYIEFDRNTVLRVSDLQRADEKTTAVVNSLTDDFVDLGDIDPVLAVASTDGGCEPCESESDDLDDLGELFG